MKRLVGFSLFALACDAGDGAAADSSGTSHGESTGVATTSAVDAGPTDSADSTDSTAGEVDDDTGDPIATGHANCAELLAAEPGTPDGIYAFFPGGVASEPPFSAYCDMTLDGGGWTLVGRSVTPDEGVPWELEYGWHYATGSPDVDSLPYSLGAAQAELEFSELIFGTYLSDKAWGPDVFKVETPEIFVYVYGSSSFPTTPITVVGDCAPKGGPNHFRFVGWTADPSVFRIIEDPFDAGTGLLPGGFNWGHTAQECETTGRVDEQQGMIMVR